MFNVHKRFIAIIEQTALKVSWSSQEDIKTFIGILRSSFDNKIIKNE